MCLRQLPFLSAVIRTNSQGQFCDFELRLEASKKKLKSISNGIKPMLDLIDQEMSKPNRALRSDIIVVRCKSALKNFKHYACGIACSTVGHALVVVWSVYPLVKLE